MTTTTEQTTCSHHWHELAQPTPNGETPKTMYVQCCNCKRIETDWPFEARWMLPKEWRRPA